MGLTRTVWTRPSEYLAQIQPDHPVLFFAPEVLQATARRFMAGFPGQVTYAVKANSEDCVIENLSAAGIAAFDVASVQEIEQLRRLCPEAVLHYNNPVRSTREIRRAVELNVRSFSVDAMSELDKLVAEVPRGAEVAVRFKLPVSGAAYDFGSKFGAAPDLAVALLARVAALGFQPSLTFHPGTQCTDPEAWESYIHAAAGIGRQAGVVLARLNVGGGFPSHRVVGPAPVLEDIFQRIEAATAAAFGPDRPVLLCEPGRAMVADSFALVARVRARRGAHDIFLNDGVYGGMAEMPLMGTIDRIEIRGPDGAPRQGAREDFILFGPTCDSLDRLPGEVRLPGDIAEEDFVLFHGMGAYSNVTTTRFNGFGRLDIVTVLGLFDA